MSVKVHLDFGHGGRDSGAIGNGIKEKDVVLDIGLKAGEIIERHNVKTSYSRTTDKFVSLSKRADMANKAKATVFCSLHSNSATRAQARGVETFRYTGSNPGLQFAKVVQEQIVNDKIFTADRGVKSANFAVLRRTSMPAILVELGFISNRHDANILKTKQDEIAESVAKGILKHIGIKYIDNKPNRPSKPNITSKTNILGQATASIQQMQDWAESKNAESVFVELAPLFYEVSERNGVNPVLTYVQSAKETGYMKFGGVLDKTFKNPCGMKTSGGGGNYDPNAHMRFDSWEDGIEAQVDHLALYAGANGYPKSNTKDPRHFPYLKGAAKTVEDLEGKWATSPSYAKDLIGMMKEVESVPVKKSNIVKVDLLGTVREMNGFIKDGTTYVTILGKQVELRKLYEDLGYEVTWDNSKRMVVIR